MQPRQIRRKTLELRAKAKTNRKRLLLSSLVSKPQISRFKWSIKLLLTSLLKMSWTKMRTLLRLKKGILAFSGTWKTRFRMWDLAMVPLCIAQSLLASWTFTNLSKFCQIFIPWLSKGRVSFRMILDLRDQFKRIWWIRSIWNWCMLNWLRPLSNRTVMVCKIIRHSN